MPKNDTCTDCKSASIMAYANRDATEKKAKQLLLELKNFIINVKQDILKNEPLMNSSFKILKFFKKLMSYLKYVIIIF